MRFGLVRTGPWAERAHGPGLVAADGVELVGRFGVRIVELLAEAQDQLLRPVATGHAG